MSNDIVTELRRRAAAIERQGETNWIYDDAADEIERLRAELASLRLTDAERKAIRTAADHLRSISLDNAFIDLVRDDADSAADVIVSLLERTKGDER